MFGDVFEIVCFCEVLETIGVSWNVLEKCWNVLGTFWNILGMLLELSWDGYTL